MILARFSESYPGINLILHVSTQLDDQKLIETDVSLRMVYEVYEDAVVRKLFPVGLGSYAHRDYIRNEIPKAGPLGEGLTWLGPPPNIPASWVSDSIYPNAEVRHALGDPMLHRELAASGAGMTRLASFLAADADGLELLPGCEVEEGPPLTIIIHPELRRTVRVRRFVDFLIKELNKEKPRITGKAI